MVGIHNRHAFAHVLEDAGRNAQLGVGAFARGDVLQIANKQDAGRRRCFTDGQMQRHMPTIFALAQHFTVSDRDGFFGVADVFQEVGVMLLGQGGGHQH